MKVRFLGLVLVFFATCVSAADLSADALEGKWLFTHMLLDGETHRDVNAHMEFLPNGEVVTYLSAEGGELSRATYEVQGGKIVYADGNGTQTWKVVEFSGTDLHVNNRGAEMFFSRQ